MNEINFWDQFKRTGSVNDYLSFVSCTKEETQEERRKEGEYSGCTNNHDRNGFNSNAYR